MYCNSLLESRDIMFNIFMAVAFTTPSIIIDCKMTLSIFCFAQYNIRIDTCKNQKIANIEEKCTSTDWVWALTCRMKQCLLFQVDDSILSQPCNQEFMDRPKTTKMASTRYAYLTLFGNLLGRIQNHRGWGRLANGIKLKKSRRFFLCILNFPYD